tara:strand:+ start:14452 stop:14787 length:336 start_codon:yes stop_codon:yes gene_type:complete
MSKSEKPKHKKFKFKRILVSDLTGKEVEASLLNPLICLLLGVPMLMYGIFLIVNPQNGLENIRSISLCGGLFCNLFAGLMLYSFRTGIYYHPRRGSGSRDGRNDDSHDYLN